MPNSEPKGRLRSEAQEKPDAENKLIFCSLRELQHFFNCLLCPRCQKNNFNLEPTVHKGIRQFLTLSCSCIQSTTSSWNTYRPKKIVPVRGSVPVRDNPYNFAYKATLHIKIALFCGQIRW